MKKQKLHIHFALDTSYDVDQDTFQNMKDLVKASLNSLDISGKTHNIKLYSFGSTSNVASESNQGMTLSNVEDMINNMERVGGDRRLDMLLRSISKPVNVLIILTTGNNVLSGQENIKSLSDQLSKDGVEVLVINIGSVTKTNLLKLIAKESSNLLFVNSGLSLPYVLGDVEKFVGRNSGKILI